MTRFGEVQVFAGLLLALFGLLFFGSLLYSVFTGQINGYQYSGASIQIPNRVFQDETITATYSVNELNPVFNPGETIGVIGNTNVIVDKTYRQIGAWFLDGEILPETITPNPNSMDSSTEITNLQTTKKQTVCLGGSASSYSNLGELSTNFNMGTGTDGSACPVLNGDTVDVMASTLVPPMTSQYTFIAGDLSEGQHTLSFRVLRVDESKCLFPLAGTGFLNNKVDQCPLYFEGLKGFYFNKQTGSPTTSFATVWQNEQQIIEYAQPIGYTALANNASVFVGDFIFERNLAQTIQEFESKFVTVTSTDFQIIAQQSPIEEICGNGLDDDSDGLIDEDCQTEPVCGDNVCSQDESVSTCPQDCQGGLPQETCDNNIDDDGDGEIDEDCETEPILTPIGALGVLLAFIAGAIIILRR